MAVLLESGRLRAQVVHGPADQQVRRQRHRDSPVLGGERGMAFGNDPEDPANGPTDDPLGGAGRAYFRDRDGHFYELVVAPAPGRR